MCTTSTIIFSEEKIYLQSHYEFKCNVTIIRLAYIPHKCCILHCPSNLKFMMHYIYMVVYQLTIIIIDEDCCSVGSAIDKHIRSFRQGDSKVFHAFNYIVSQDSNTCAGPIFPNLKCSHIHGQNKVRSRP